jgi:hypothetical protein
MEGIWTAMLKHWLAKLEEDMGGGRGEVALKLNP